MKKKRDFKKRSIIAMILTMMLIVSSILPVMAARSDPGEGCPGHEWYTTDTSEASCNSSGVAYYACSICGEEYQEEIPALGHAFEQTDVKMPTCESDGWYLLECARCHETQKETVASYGHNYESTVTKEPTCTESGTIVKHCSECGNEIVDAIPAKGHTYSESTVVIEARCDQPGMKTAVCTSCGKTVEDEIPMIPHTIGEYKVIKVPTDFSAGTEEAVCSVCGKKDTRDVYPDGMLNKGDRGDAVKQLQENLNSKGYDCGVADGIFGDKTSDAIGKFEEAFNLPVDGLAWPGIQKMLNLYLQIVSIDNDKQVYAVGESITIRLSVTNESNTAISLVDYHVSVYEQNGNELEGYNNELQLEETGAWNDTTLQPGEIAYGDYHMTLGPLPGESQIAIYITGQDPSGESVSSNSCYHDIVTGDVPIEKKQVAEGVATPKDDGPKASLLLELVSDPSEMTAYTVGSVELEYRVTNTGNTTMTVNAYAVTDIDDNWVSGADSEFPDNANLLKPGESGIIVMKYPVNSYDIYLSNVCRKLQVFGSSWINETDGSYTLDVNSNWTGDGIDVASNQVTATVDMVYPEIQMDGDDVDEGDYLSFDIEKVEVSAPQNGEYYVEGETIDYLITLTNNGNQDLGEIIVYDSLKQDSYGEIGSAESLHVGQTREFTYSYQVTAENVENGVVKNYAYAIYPTPVDNYIKVAGPVESPTGKSASAEKQAKIRKTDGDGPCYRKLEAKGDGTAAYTEHVCEQHMPTLEKGEKLAETNTVEAWKEAAELYKADINAMYMECFIAATDDSARYTISMERALYFKQIEAFAESLKLIYKDDEVSRAKAVAEALQDRSVDFCYEIHTAQSERVDSYLSDYEKIAEKKQSETCEQSILSDVKPDVFYAQQFCNSHAATDNMTLNLLNEEDIMGAMMQSRENWKKEYDIMTFKRYLEAETDQQELIAAERKSFDKWISERENFLKLLYSDKPLIVEEMMAQIYMNRVIGLCDQMS